VLSWVAAMELISEPASVYTLVGNEFVLMNLFIQNLQTQLQTRTGQEVDVSHFRFEDEGCSGAIFACQSVSLFASSSLVVLENCTGLLATGKAKHDVTELEAYVVNPIPDRVLVITVLGEKLDERKKVTKALKSRVIVDCNTPKEPDAIAVVQRLAKQRGIAIAEDGMKELWRRAPSVSQSTAELGKLWTFTNGTEIRISDVAQLVALPLEDNVFTWIDGVVQGDLERSFRALRDVELGGYDAFALLSLIARQLRLMWHARVYGDKGYSHQQIAGKVGAHPYAIRVAATQARKVSPNHIEHLMTIVADAEYEIKSGRRDVRQALEWVVLSCASAAKR
jgi:DNA polymerase-3 subunit delta